MTAQLSGAGVPINNIRDCSANIGIKIYVVDQKREKKPKAKGEGESYVRASPSYLCTSLLRLPSQLRPFAFTSSHSRVFALKAKVRRFAVNLSWTLYTFHCCIILDQHIGLI